MYINLNFHKIDGFHKSGLSSQSTSIQNSPGSGDNLSATSVDSISMESHVIDVKSNCTHVFVTKHTLKLSGLRGLKLV